MTVAKERICVVVPTGLDGGGTTTLGLEYSKLGYDTYFFDINKNNSCKVDLEDTNIKFFNRTEELLTIIENYDRIILGLFYFKGNKAKVLDLTEIKKNYTNKEVIYVDCYRGNYRLKLRAEEIVDNNYDLVWCLSDHIAEKYNELGIKTKVLDFNLYNWEDRDIVDSSLLDKKVITVGRVAGMKGSINLLREAKTLCEDVDTRDFYYIYEGADYSVSKNGSYSIMMNLLEVLMKDADIKRKEPHDYLVLNKDYEEYDSKLVKDKYNFFPTYNKDIALDRWKYCKYALMPYLGVGDNSKTSVYKNPECWDRAPEYCVYELSNAGVPMFFSRDYADRIGYNNDIFIYDKFEDIPSLIKSIESQDISVYDEARREQISFFKEMAEKTKEDIEENFVENI